MLERKKHIEEFIEGAQLLRRAVSDTARFKDAGITGSQWLVVAHLAKHEGCTTNDVAEALNMTGSAATQLINGLVDKGFVVRKYQGDDKRTNWLGLSASSKKRISALKTRRARTMEKIFKELTDAEFRQYVALNKKIITAVSKKHV